MERRRLDFQDFDSLVHEIKTLQDQGYEQLGNWNLTMVCDHVGTGAKTAMDGFPKQGPWYIRKIAGPILIKLMLRQRRMKAGLKVPDWWLPQAVPDDPKKVDDFLRTIARFREFDGPMKPHPFLGKLSREQWRQLVLIHAAHHLSFLRPDASLKS